MKGEASMKGRHANGGIVEGCKFCDDMKRKGETFFPPHEPSMYCESGKRPHCTCDRCF